MNKNKYPNLAWCEKYGHLFPSTGCVFGKCKSCETLSIRQRGKEYFCKNLSCTSSDKFKVKMIANCPDALEIMEWLWDQDDRYQVKRCTVKGFIVFDWYGTEIPLGLHIETMLEAIMKSVKIVEAK